MMPPEPLPMASECWSSLPFPNPDPIGRLSLGPLPALEPAAAKCENEPDRVDAARSVLGTIL